MAHELHLVEGKKSDGTPVFGVILKNTKGKLVYVFPEKWDTRDQAKGIMKSFRTAYMFGRRGVQLELKEETHGSSNG